MLSIVRGDGSDCGGSGCGKTVSVNAFDCERRW